MPKLMGGYRIGPYQKHAKSVEDLYVNRSCEVTNFSVKQDQENNHTPVQHQWHTEECADFVWLKESFEHLVNPLVAL
jgi:hypothetical protein